MPAKVFVDTAFITALVNRRDKYHQQATDLSSEWEGLPLLTTDAVLLEVGNAVARGFKSQAVAIIEQFRTSTDVEIVHLTPQLFDRAFALYKNYRDKEWSLVDCISFVVMREADVSQALTSDQHFVQAGFQSLMS